MASNYQDKPGIYPSLQTPVDTDTRDPHDINKHLRLDFFNVIAEPDPSAHSFEAIHTISNKVYHYSKLFIYRLLTLIVGLPLMLVWGLIFGAYTFFMIWIMVPIRRLAQSVIAEEGILVQTISDAVIAPIYRSFGLIWSSVRVSLSSQTIHSTKQVQV